MWPLFFLSRPRSLIKLILLVLSLYFFGRTLYYSVISTVLSIRGGISFPMRCSSQAWSSPYSGWYNRSTLIEDTSHIHFSNSTGFRIASSLSSWGHQYFKAAMFEPGVCVTATAALRMADEDFKGISKLADLVQKSNPRRFHSRNPGVSDMALTTLDIRTSNSKERRQQVSGFSRDSICRGADEMPAALRELFGLLVSGEIGGLNSTGQDFARLRAEVYDFLRLDERRPWD